MARFSSILQSEEKALKLTMVAAQTITMPMVTKVFELWVGKKGASPSGRSQRLPSARMPLPRATRIGMVVVVVVVGLEKSKRQWPALRRRSVKEATQ